MKIDRIWVDEPPLESILPLLAGRAELIGPGALIEELAGCVAALDPGVPWTAARMDLAPQLRVISRIGVGFDNIDIPAATDRGILVCNTPQAPSQSTAEHAVGLIFAAAKAIVQADAQTRSGQWHRNFRSHKGLELHSRVLGLVGAGRIGSTVARIMRAVGMRVLVFDPGLSVVNAAELGVELVADLRTLLEQSDVVSLHAPSTPATRNLMNAERLAWMKRGAILVNTSRGALVDEAALTAALISGQLAAAGLDVFQREPVPDDSPLLKLDNVVLTDHIASHTWAGHHRLYETAVRHVLEVLAGQRPAALLNPECPGRAVVDAL
ncbi:MAG: phosphoglycerate dehydrogenase [Planctomycetaceae bacterium]